MANKSSNDDTARQIGRGAIFIALGKVVFLFAGATINFVLPRLLSKADYGNYGVVVRIISLLNMMTVIGLLQSVSKLVSEQPNAVATIRWRSLRTAAVAAAAVAGLFAVAAPLIAWGLRDEGLTPALMTASVITFGYGLYAVAIGTVNGLKRFRDQALFDMGFSICKVTFILGGSALLGGLGARWIEGALPAAERGLGTVGAVAGFALAALVMTVVSHVAVGRLPKTEAGEAVRRMPLLTFARRLLFFAGAVMVYQGLLNALMSADLLIVKRHFAGELAARAGVYNGSLNVAQLPYFGVLAITFVAFPLISATTFSEDRETTRRYIMTAFRYGALIACAVCAVLAASARDILNLIFPQGYAEGAVALVVLVCGYALLAQHSIGCTILNAAGRPARSAAATLAGAVTAATVAALLVEPLGLVGAALGTLCGGVVGLTLSLVLLRATTGAVPGLLSSARIIAAGVVVVVGGLLLPDRGALWAVPFSLAAGVLFLAILVVTRELGREDLRTVLAPFRRARR